jgi:hypothetical protein
LFLAFLVATLTAAQRETSRAEQAHGDTEVIIADCPRKAA